MSAESGTPDGRIRGVLTADVPMRTNLTRPTRAYHSKRISDRGVRARAYLHELAAMPIEADSHANDESQSRA